VLPGTLPRAHRGIVFVDEINRLADTSPALVDVLLDAMGTKPGRVQIEETGLQSVELPLSVSVWAASNPDEEPGPLQEIRRQLSDRFDFVVRIERPDRADTVRAIINAGSRRAFETQAHRL
jgi:magnesium chelatase subunit I